MMLLNRVAWDKAFGFRWKLELPNEETTNSSKIKNLSIDPNTWDVYWCDGGITMRFFQQMKLYQVCNHLPGMNLITRKDTLAQSLK